MTIFLFCSLLPLTFQPPIPPVGVLKDLTDILLSHFQIFPYLHYLSLPLDMLIYFSVTVFSAAFTLIPRTSTPFTSKCVPWWNLDCTRALHVKRAACCSFHCKRNTPEHLSAFIFFKRFSAVSRKTINIFKNLSWCSYASSLT